MLRWRLLRPGSSFSFQIDCKNHGCFTHCQYQRTFPGRAFFLLVFVKAILDHILSWWICFYLSCVLGSSPQRYFTLLCTERIRDSQHILIVTEGYRSSDTSTTGSRTDVLEDKKHLWKLFYAIDCFLPSFQQIILKPILEMFVSNVDSHY